MSTAVSGKNVKLMCLLVAIFAVYVSAWDPAQIPGEWRCSIYSYGSYDLGNYETYLFDRNGKVWNGEKNVKYLWRIEGGYLQMKSSYYDWSRFDVLNLNEYEMKLGHNWYSYGYGMRGLDGSTGYYINTWSCRREVDLNK